MSRPDSMLWFVFLIGLVKRFGYILARFGLGVTFYIWGLYFGLFAMTLF
jgi:hypothetical protein